MYLKESALSFSYYMDESGNTGDLISRSEDLKFSGQPIFTLSCVGISDIKKVEDFISRLKLNHDLEDSELKSSELYFNKPEVFLDLARFITNERLPILVELVDKKYCVSVSMVNHHIMPPYYMPKEAELDGSAQFIRNGVADYLTSKINDSAFKEFCKACKEPSEINLLSSMSKLKSLFNGEDQQSDFYQLTVKSIDETIDDYQVMKSKVGEEDAIKKFIPVPDTTEKGVSIKLLPHVHCIYSIIARLNKYHLKNISDVTIFHDKQNDFDFILTSCKEHIVNTEFNETIPPVHHSDYDILENIKLEFVDSKHSSGIQIADLLAGFFNRYINGLLYKNVHIDDVYHSIFREFRKSFHPMSPLGVNFVIPESKQQIVFRKFNF